MKAHLIALGGALAWAAAAVVSQSATPEQAAGTATGAAATSPTTSSGTSAASSAGNTAPRTEKATFAGGCFWCVEVDFDKVPGVLSTTSGYIGGTVAHPTYQQVSAQTTGHAEAVEIVFDPNKVSYQQLLNIYWRSIDPTTVDRQFCDAGSPYRTAIFAHGPQQLAAAQASKAALEKSKPFREPIVTQIHAATTFYPAESYHQDYYKKNPVRYQFYRASCGRDARLKALWGAAAAP
jgi:peptide-methionine (S)-S-oxide reductase